MLQKWSIINSVITIIIIINNNIKLWLISTIWFNNASVYLVSVYWCKNVLVI